MNYIKQLTSLRGFAAWWVVAYHFRDAAVPSRDGVLYELLGMGYLAVDFFFILSGFLIYLITKNGENWKHFALKRVFRIYPLYWCSLILYLLWQYFYITSNYSIATYLQNVLMVPWNGSLTTQSLIVGVAWSTVYEVYFYAAFTILLAFKLKKVHVFSLLLGAFITIRLLYYFNFFSTAEDSVFLFLYSVLGYRHIIPFIIGMIVAILYHDKSIAKTIEKLYFRKAVFIGIHILYIIILCLDYKAIISYLISVPIFVMYLKLDYFWNINYDSALSTIFVKIGDVSFSIYILHMLFISIIVDYFEIQDLVLATILAYLTTISFSLLTYTFIELPFMNFAKSIIQKDLR